MIFNKFINRSMLIIKKEYSGIRDTIVSSIPQIIRMGTGMIISILVARGLGAERLGYYALVMSIGGFVKGLENLGIGKTAVRYASRAVSIGNIEEQLAVLRWGFRLRMMISVVLSVIAFILAPAIAIRFWDAEHLIPLIRISLLIGIFSALSSIPSIYFQSLRRFGMNSKVKVTQAIISLTGILIIAWINKWTVAQVIGVSVIATAMGSLLMLILVPRKALYVKYKKRGKNVLSVLKSFFNNPTKSHNTSKLDKDTPNTFASFLMLSSITVIIMLQIDVWLMGYFLKPEEIGQYYVAKRFAIPITAFLGAISVAIWPRASALKEISEIKEKIKRTFRLSLMALGPFIIYSIFVPLLAPYLFGQEYKDVVLLAQLICLQYGFTLIVNPLAAIGYSLGLVKLYFVMNITQLFVLVLVNILLLPKIGFYAPVLALAVNSIIVFCFLLPTGIKLLKQK